MVYPLSGYRTKGIWNSLWLYDKDAYHQFTIRIMTKDKKMFSFSLVKALWIQKQIPEATPNEFGKGLII